jgi:hypothetical protein
MSRVTARELQTRRGNTDNFWSSMGSEFYAGPDAPFVCEGEASLGFLARQRSVIGMRADRLGRDQLPSAQGWFGALARPERRVGRDPLELLPVDGESRVGVEPATIRGITWASGAAGSPGWCQIRQHRAAGCSDSSWSHRSADRTPGAAQSLNCESPATPSWRADIVRIPGPRCSARPRRVRRRLPVSAWLSAAATSSETFNNRQPDVGGGGALSEPV